MKQADAIVRAIAAGNDTKGAALREAHATLAGAGSYTVQHDLACTWTILEQEGRIVRRGRRWVVRG